MKDDRLFVFAGSGTRYTLRPFAEYIRKQGHSVIELDTEASDCISRIKEIPGGSIIYITSDHLGLDKGNYGLMIPGQFSVANLEIMEELRPKKSILYTHDLGKIVGVWSEQRYLDLFSLILFPFVCNDFYFAKRRFNSVEEIGWIKKKENFSIKRIPTENKKIVYFPSNMMSSLERYGIEGYADWIEHTIDKSISIKPSSFIKMRPVSEILKERGYTILDTTLTPYDIMETSDLIITNGCSSVVYEAAYSGCPVVSILDGFDSDKQYIMEKPQLRWVYSLYPEDVMLFVNRVRKGELELDNGKDIIKPFDFEKAYQLVSG